MPWLVSVKWTVSPSVIRNVGAGTWPPKFIERYALSGDRAMRIVWLGPSLDVRLNSTGADSAGRYGGGTAKLGGLGSCPPTAPDGEGMAPAIAGGLAEAAAAVGLGVPGADPALEPEVGAAAGESAGG